MVFQDILLDPKTNKLLIVDGDYARGPSDGQSMRLLLFSNQGNWRRAVTKGIGIRRVINVKQTPKGILSLKKEITVQAVGDGNRVDSLKITPSTFSIDYERAS